MTIHRVAGLAALAVVVAARAHTQTVRPPLEPRAEIPGIVRALAPLLIPKVLGDCWQLKEYLRSEEFAGVRHSYGDLFAVDLIYDRALRLAWNNEYEALLIAAIATMDHRRVGLQLPLLGPLVWFPLTSEFPEEFDARVDALPSHLYPDTPPGRMGDRDKLQHFFGSAFLAYTFETNSAPERIGDFIEWGEERFVIEGVNDERDQRANFQGRLFGLRLLEDDTAQPSDCLQPVYVQQPAGPEFVPGPRLFVTEEQ